MHQYLLNKSHLQLNQLVKWSVTKQDVLLLATIRYAIFAKKMADSSKLIPSLAFVCVPSMEFLSRLKCSESQTNFQACKFLHSKQCSLRCLSCFLTVVKGGLISESISVSSTFILKSDNLQFNTVGRHDDSMILPPSQRPMFILINWE